MQSNKKIQEIGRKLPHGAKKAISKKSGVSYNTVCSFFKGKEVSFGVEVKLIPIINEYLELFKTTEEARKKLLNYGC